MSEVTLNEFLNEGVPVKYATFCGVCTATYETLAERGGGKRMVIRRDSTLISAPEFTTDEAEDYYKGWAKSARGGR